MERVEFHHMVVRPTLAPGRLVKVAFDGEVMKMRAPRDFRVLAGALQRWAAGADLVMGGHIHLPCVMALHGLARPMWAVQAGTAVSSRVRQGVPNSVNLLRWGADSAPGCCVIEQRNFSAAELAFVRAGLAELRPAKA